MSPSYRSPPAEGIILGSPDYFFAMSARVKGFIDKWLGLHVKVKLKNKVGAAFVSADGTGTGAETTALSLITSMVSCEMVSVSTPGREAEWPATYGVIADNLGAIGYPDEKMLNYSKELGKRVAEAARKLWS